MKTLTINVNHYPNLEMAEFSKAHLLELNPDTIEAYIKHEEYVNFVTGSYFMAYTLYQTILD